MAIHNFPTYRNFSLDDSTWGAVRPGDLIKTFESCIKEFYSKQNIPDLPTNEVRIDNVQNDPQSMAYNSYDPIWYPGFQDRIYLNCNGKVWDRYAYQFSHELCHHIIKKPSNVVDNFGWLEESMCELASIFCLTKMAGDWLKQPPYPNWKSYSFILAQHASDILNDPACAIIPTFKNWLQGELPSLYTNRYQRNKNRIIAINLFPLFNKNPTLWQCVQHYHKVNCAVKGITTLQDFLVEWNRVLPDNLKRRFQAIIDVLV